MSPARPRHEPTPGAAALVQGVAVQLGSRIREERVRRGWTLRRLGGAARLSATAVHDAESGRCASLETYARLLHALGLRFEFDLSDRRVRNPTSGADPVHAAMGELEAAHLRAAGFAVSLDEPYQHYQFAGRADVLAWSVTHRALLHIENRTRFPNLQEAAGSYNAKRAYLGAVLAERLEVRGGFRSETHVLVALWSAEVLHSIRLRRATFRALCPDSISAFDSWWSGTPWPNGRSSAFVLLDPLASGRERRFVDLDVASNSARPRVRYYAEAARRLSSERT